MSEPRKFKLSAAKIVMILVAASALILVAMITLPDLIVAHTQEYKALCVNNLRIIDNAKARWALESHKTHSDVPKWADIKPYLEPGFTNTPLRCLSGGIYTLGAVSNLPTCSIPGHVLP
jgi:hypothetical protein